MGQSPPIDPLREGKWRPSPVVNRPGATQFLLHVPLATALLLLVHRHILSHPGWIPIHDSLTQFTEFQYAYSALQGGELPLWNSYLYGGQPFYLLLNHGLLLDPLLWLWMGLGALLGLHPLSVYVLTHLSGAVLFALGGMLLAWEITDDVPAAVTAYLALLFSGEVCFWIVQVYSLALIETVPWVIWSAMRYARNQTAVRAVQFGTILAIALNRYYPVYLITFGMTALVLFGLFYIRSWDPRRIKKLLVHGAAVLPLVALLVLPTYLAYAEMNRDNYQISRFQGPAQEDPVSGKAAGWAELGTFTHTLIRNTIGFQLAGWFNEAIPFIGIVALVFFFMAFRSFSRRVWYWSALLLITILHYAGNKTPFIHIDNLLIPYYKLMRTPGFYSGYVTLAAAMLASIGVGNYSSLYLASSHPRTRTSLLKVLIPLALAAVLVFLYPTRNAPISLYALLALTAVLVYARMSSQTLFTRSVVLHMLLLVLLATGTANMIASRGTLNRLRIDEMFTYGGMFNFAFERPDRYTIQQPDVFVNNDDECCATFYHVAEKIDGPHFFGNWGSQHTLFVSKDYYRYSAIRGFADLMKEKLHFFRFYTVTDRIDNYDDLLSRSVLAVHDDGRIGARDSRVNAAQEVPAGAGPERMVTLLRKTANTVKLGITMAEDTFLLYTDLYHEGFAAKIDGRAVPILRAMGTFKAVELPAGKHVVEFRFVPVYRYPLAAYLSLSGLSMLLLLCWGVMRLWRTIRGVTQGSEGPDEHV